MEVTIPPRDHGDEADRYHWDENGEVTNVEKITPRKPARLTRQTVQWPFQSISLETNTYTLPTIPQSPASTITAPQDVHLIRKPSYRATWQPRRTGSKRIFYDNDDDEEDEKATIRRSLIPDYVINYLRGETPETVAQRKIERRKEEEETLKSQEDLRLRGGGSRNSGVIDGHPLPSPNGYRRSDEPMLRGTDYYNEKRRSYGTNGQGGRRRQTRRRGIVAHGWRAGVALYGLLSVVIFIVGLAGLVVALTVLKNDGSKMSLATVFTSRAVPVSDVGSSSCSGAHPVAWLLRAIVSLFSIALLAGAQYVFQVLSSPTRAEIDAAHSSRQWLDVGVPSLRNIVFLLKQRKARAVLALVVVAVAVASTVLYGALIGVVLVAPLSSAASPSYNVLLVSPTFLEGATFSNGSSNNAGGLDRVTILQLQQLAANTKQQTLTNLTASECLQAQSSASTMSAVQEELALFDINDGTKNASLISSSKYSAVLIVLTDDAVTALQATNSSVVQTAPAGSELLAASSSSSSVFQITKDGEDSRSELVVNKASVAFCLAQTATTTATTGAAAAAADDDTATTACRVTLNTTLLSAIVGLNVVTVLSFGYLLLPRKAHRHFRQAPLIMLGDAIASFLRDPDPTTRGACLLSKEDVVQHGVWKGMVDQPRLPGFGPQDGRPSVESTGSDQSAQLPENIMQPMFLDGPADERGNRKTGTYFWFQSVSMMRWFVGSVAWWVVFGLALAAFVVVVSRDAGLGSFGQIAPLSSAEYSSSMMTPTALLGALPLLGVAALYLLVDTHLSAYFLSHESAQYVAAHQHHRNEQLQQHCRRPLRVSYRPRGHQTTSLYLTVPQAWHWVLVVLVAALLFAVSEGVVVTGVQAVDESSLLALLGFSGVGLVVVLVLLAGVALLVVVLGARRTPPPNASLGRNPLTLPGGSCSAVISARCHPMPEEMPTEVTGQNGSNGGPLPLWLRPLAWGPVPSYHHPYQGYNRQRGLTREGQLLTDGTLEEDNIDAIVGHCAFSSGPLMPLDAARSYA